jgi:hypothetical protein
LGRALGDADPAGTVVLLGGAGAADFRLRIAQSHARRDLLPSFWSHVALLGKATGKADWGVSEVSLEPPGGFGAVPLRNGVQQGTFGAYDDPARYPNLACFRIPAGEKFGASMAAAIESFQMQRSLVDLGAHIVDWLAFLWGVASAGNPLLANKGIPSAVFVEAVFAIAGVELTPGIASQNSCPEAIWQAAKWWHEFYESEATLAQAAPTGAYVIGQPEAAAVFEPGKTEGPRPRKR